MTPLYLLDTNVVSEPLRAEAHRGVVERMRHNNGRMCIGSVVWHEMLFGLARLPDGSRKRRIADYLYEVVAPSIPVVDYDGLSAALHAEARAHAEQTGQSLSWADGMIAATARAHNLILVTRNVSDFVAFPSLRIENWFADAS